MTWNVCTMVKKRIKAGNQTVLKQVQDYKNTNQAYWEKRACSYSKLNQHQLESAQHIVWKDFIDKLIQDHLRDLTAKQCVCDKRQQRRLQGVQSAAPQSIQAQVQQSASIRNNIKVLDIGTGPGFFAIILAELGYQVSAIDYTHNMLEEAWNNAGNFKDEIEFIQMNAEELSFPDESFDLVISRNLSWNLVRPMLAYKHWARVLKPGGLLLNFDANWYHYLFKSQAKEARQKDREHVKLAGVQDDTAGTDTLTMEALAKKAPLSQRERPAWDLAVLNYLGLEASADTQVYKQLWSLDEWINNASTPLFLIQAKKPLTPVFNESSFSNEGSFSNKAHLADKSGSSSS